MLNNFFLALHFLTGIYIKKLDCDEKKLSRATQYFPLIGVLIGCVLAVVNFLFSFVFSPVVVCAVIVVCLILITRGFHLDGFIDTVDGIFGGMNKDERLKIMKDTNIGSFGAIGVVSLLLLKYTLLLELSGDKLFPVFLILMPALSRWSMVCAMVLYPYLREKGTGHFTKLVGKNEVTVASLTIFVFVFAFMGINGLIILTSTLILMLLISKYISSKIGGMTGDTYGALNETIEVMVLALFTVV